MMKKNKFFINLTNGIEFLRDYKIIDKDIHFIRLLSSHCETKKWNRILEWLPDDFLMYLALGYNCIVVDASSKNRKPRALWQGLEWIKFVLYKIWFNRNYKLQGRARSMYKYFKEKYKEIPFYLKRKLAYFKHFLLTEELNIKVWYRQTNLEGSWDEIKLLLISQLL